MRPAEFQAFEASPITADEVGHAAAFLPAALGVGMTGSTIYVDDGYHMMGKAVTDRYSPPNQ